MPAAAPSMDLRQAGVGWGGVGWDGVGGGGVGAGWFVGPDS